MSNNNSNSSKPYIPNSLQWLWDPYLPGSANPSAGAGSSSGGAVGGASLQQPQQPSSSLAMAPSPPLVPAGSTAANKSKSKGPPVSASSSVAGTPYTVSAVSDADGKVTMKLTKAKAETGTKVKAKPKSKSNASAVAVAATAAATATNANSNILSVIDSVAKGTTFVASTPSLSSLPSTRAPQSSTAPSATVTSATLSSTAIPPVYHGASSTWNIHNNAGATANTPVPPPATTTASYPLAGGPVPSPSLVNYQFGQRGRGYPRYTPTVSNPYPPYPASGPVPTAHQIPPPLVTYAGTAPAPPIYPGVPPAQGFPYYPPVPAANVVQATRRAKGKAALKNAAFAMQMQAAAAAATSLAPPAPSNILPPLPVQAEPLVPPNWKEHYDETSIALSTYKTFPVDPTSLEYQTITEMLDPVKVISAEKIVNPDLWERYANTRKEMLRTKSDDLSLLSKIGLEDREVMRRAHFSLNFDKDPLLTTPTASFSPNEVLLFHCTRNKDNLNKILLQGLDERLSSTTGGLLGKGIYFADDPQKAMQYDGGNFVILIFAVLLGDCLGVDHIASKHTMVREPEKEKDQKRNFNDQFFDSITARPAQHNEFVIYNRFQCCPLYMVKYQRGAAYGSQLNSYSTARQISPTVAWRITQGKKFPMPNQTLDGGWPFFAALLFEKMGVLPPPLSNNDDDDQFESLLPDSNSAAMVDGIPNMDDDDDTDEKLASLQSLGFFDDAKNKEVLKMYNNNLDRAANHLLDSENSQTQQQPSASGTSSSSAITITSASPNKVNAKPSATVTVDLTSTSDSDSEAEAKNSEKKKAKLIDADLPDELADWALEFDEDLFQGTKSPPPKSQEECHICCYEFDSFSQAPSLWKELQCSHKVCKLCYANIETSGTTMAGVFHTSVKCPFCQGITGAEVGTCPTGKMTVVNIAADCEGYTGYGTIQITYQVSSGPHTLHRTAYLPDNQEGKEVLKLLRIAWDRRLCFAIGTSVTTGAQNVLVWNIHHKTAIGGGVQSHGYPDPGYLERVKWELKAYGIE